MRIQLLVYCSLVNVIVVSGVSLESRLNWNKRKKVFDGAFTKKSRRYSVRIYSNCKYMSSKLAMIYN